MDYLYAPWRKQYMQKVNDQGSGATQKTPCVFCEQFAQERDREHFILRRFKHHVVMLNLYPYNNGHLLIVTHEHVNHVRLLSDAARIELIQLTNEITKIMNDVLNAPGINIGINMGKAAGAGIPDHLHMHVLPRWIGDTNFLPLLAHTKHISVNLHEMYEALEKPIHAINV